MEHRLADSNEDKHIFFQEHPKWSVFKAETPGPGHEGMGTFTYVPFWRMPKAILGGV